jgi:hypothetical protein
LPKVWNKRYETEKPFLKRRPPRDEELKELETLRPLRLHMVLDGADMVWDAPSTSRHATATDNVASMRAKKK